MENTRRTEANFWGLREGLTKYPNGLIYSSNSAHYGVDKFINIIGQEKSVKISSNRGKIDTQELLEKITNNYEKDKTPAVILLTCGTTALGSIDDIIQIKHL